MRYSHSEPEHLKNNWCSIDSPEGAGKDAHYAECHSDSLEVGIADEFAYQEIVSRLRVVGSERSMYHSIGLDEPRNSSSGRQSISQELGKRRAKVSGESIFLDFVPIRSLF